MISRRAWMGGAAATAALSSRNLAAAAANATPARLLMAADVHVAGYPTVAAVERIGALLMQHTGGRLGVRVYHSGQLGREADAVDLARFGALDIARVNFASINDAFPLTRIAAMPFVFDSTAHMRRAMDGEAGAQILRGFEARGLVGLAIYDSGIRCVYNVLRPVHVPQDLHGLKLRVPPSDIFIDLMRGLGANPTPLAFGEVYSALQTRLIDGAENNIKSFDSSRHYEIAGYWSETRHSYAPEALVMSRQRFELLSPADRELLFAAVRESVPYMRSLWDEAEAQSRARVMAAGVKFNDADLQAFQRAAGPLRARELASPASRSLYDLIRAVA